MYFVINSTENGTYIEVVTKEELIERLEEEYYGEIGFLKNINETDTNYWGKDILIIKGEIVVPKPVNIIKSFEI